MHFHHQRGVRIDGIGIIGQMGPVGRAGFAQGSAGPLHDIWDAERTADFHQFAARHDHFASEREGIEQQQYRSGIVVGHGRGFRAGEFA